MVSIGSNIVEFNVNEVSPAMNQSIHSETTSEQLFMEETSTITGEDVLTNGLPAPPDKSSSKTENFLIIASTMKSPEKSRNLENALEKIKKLKYDDAFEKQFTQNVILKIRRDLQTHKKENMKHIKECFGDMLDNMDHVDWLSVKLTYNPNRFKRLLSDNVVNRRKSLQPETYQDIYSFWLNNSINSNDSRSNVVNISRRFFLQQYKFITDQNLMEKEKIYQK